MLDARNRTETLVGMVSGSPESGSSEVRKRAVAAKEETGREDEG